MKTSENLTVFCFQGLEKGCNGKNGLIKKRRQTWLQINSLPMTDDPLIDTYVIDSAISRVDEKELGKKRWTHDFADSNTTDINHYIIPILRRPGVLSLVFRTNDSIFKRSRNIFRDLLSWKSVITKSLFYLEVIFPWPTLYVDNIAAVIRVCRTMRNSVKYLKCRVLQK